MRPERFGRTLGIGVRVASNILRDRAGRIAQGNGQQPPRTPVSSSDSNSHSSVNPRTVFATRDLTQTAQRTAAETGKATRAVSRGSKNFAQAVWGPFRHVGGVLWLEISGVFFALFALFFAQNVYRTRAAWWGGAEHVHFLLYIGVTAVFVWFSLSSFMRAHQKSKKPRVR
jgi:hypothetical protein